MKLCIKGGLILNPATRLMGIGNLWISEDQIATLDMEKESYGMIPPESMEGVTVIDATGKLVVPGFIDLHVHLREPGFTEKETIQSGSEAAAKGGFTTICCMPNTRPVIDSTEVLDFISWKTAKNNGVRVLPVAAMSQGQEGEELSPLAELAEYGGPWSRLLGKGICGISEDGQSLADARLALEAMKKAKELSLPVFSHAEDPGLPGSALGEALMMARDIRLAKEAGCHLHFCHVSTGEGVELIREARSQGLPVTGETAPHYFTLTDQDGKGNPDYKMNPPLRTGKDREAIIEGLKDGTLSAIATDHAPHTREDKAGGYEKAANGIVGLETSFALGYTHLVEKGKMELMELVKRMTQGPAEILGIPAGDLSPGKVADVVVIDVERPYRVDRELFGSKGRNTPFEGWSLFGKALFTIAEGRVIWQDPESGGRIMEGEENR